MDLSTKGIMITIAVYLIGMIAIGIIYSRKTNDVGDFYLGGRKLGPLVTAMSAEASDMSSWLLMGLPGVAYLCGIAEASWTAIGLAVGTYINWLVVAKRIRRYSQKINAITIPDFFSRRFHDDKNILTLAAALVIIVFFVPYVGSGFAACGKLFGTLFGVSYLPAMIISALVILCYTMLGGFLAASTTDLIQSIVMTIALVVVLVFGIHSAGGWEAVAENAKSIGSYLSLTTTLEIGKDGLRTGGVTSYGVLTVVSTLAWGLGYFGMPHVLLRFMAIKDERKLKTSRRIASVWVVISMTIAVFIGVIGNAMTANGSIGDIANKSDSETVIIKIAQLMSTNGPVLVILAGIILAGILAATMSTADSQLLAASSSVSQNLFCEVIGVKMSKKKEMLIARATVLAIGVIAIVVARKPDSSVFRIVSFAWAGFGAAFGPVMLMSLFWKRTTKWGALAGILTGGVMVFVWKYLIAAKVGGIFAIYELLPAFVISLIVIVVVSLLTKAPSQEIIDEFESVKNMKPGESMETAEA